MLFDTSNYWIFLIVLAALYVCLTVFLQANIGGKNRLKNIQVEIRNLQIGMSEAAKRKDDRALDEAIAKNWKLTMELLVIQTQMFVVILGILFILLSLFPFVEPGHENDMHMALYDDGLASHCDKVAGDGIYSNCFALPENGTRGAWVIDGYLRSSTGDQMSRNGTAIYYDGGQPSDVWIQSASQTGIFDALLGKTAYHLNVTTGQLNYTDGQTVQVYAQPIPAIAPGANVTMQVSVNDGSFFHIDLPFTIPLINIRRIIGSYGVFLFMAFVMGTIYSIGRAIYALRKKP